MKKRGFVWISAVLYIALGVVAISLVLTAGLPLINKLSDRNTITQTKELLHIIDRNIQQVSSEGVGSRRYLDPVIIKGGKLRIFNMDVEEPDKIYWEMKTKAIVSEPCEEGVDFEDLLNPDSDYNYCLFKEGSLYSWLSETIVEDEYTANLLLNYEDTFKIKCDEESPLTGKYAIAISYSRSDDIPEITIDII